MSIGQRGHIGFWLCPELPGWATDSNAYRFRLLDGSAGDVWAEAEKRPDRTLRILVRDRTRALPPFHVPLPALRQSPSGEPGLHIAILWQHGVVELFLFGSLVETHFTSLGSDGDALRQRMAQESFDASG
jgi:hypothetical protein